MTHIAVDDIVYHILVEAKAMRDLYHIPVVKNCSVVNCDYAGDLTAEQSPVKHAISTWQLRMDASPALEFITMGMRASGEPATGRK